MKKLIFLVVTAFAVTLSFGQTNVFINEIHYENNGSDINEGVEIAGPAGTDLTGWSIELYNNSTSMVYVTISLSGTIPDLENGRGTLWFPQSNIQNETEALSLINALNTVVQFISYEGVITATDGVANGMTSIDIGVSELSSTPAGYSLQLSGTGTDYEDFTWFSPDFSTEGLENNGQTFTGSSPTIIDGFNVSGLDYIGSGPSLEGSFIIEGTNLTNDIVITSPSNFEISESSGGGWTSAITLLKGAGTTISTTTIYVRLKSGLSIGTYNQNVSCTSSGALSKTLSLSGIVSPNVGSIIITEIMQNPESVDDSDGEYFEVYNTTGTDIDMQGWVISDIGSDSHTIGSSVIVLANDYAVFTLNSDNLTNGGFNADYEYSGITLGNTSDEIILTNGSTEIDRVHYSSSLAGVSTELHLFYYDSVSNDTESNWGSATTAYGGGDLGTPGAINDFGLSVVKNQIEDFKMYPNPVVNGRLYMSSSGNLNKQVKIYALTGQQVFSESLQTQEYLNVSNLNKGIYLVKISEDGKLATRKLVIN